MTGERKPHPYVRIWVSDIVQSCQEMTPRQFGAHVRMLLHAWDRGYCSADPGKLSAITGPVPEDEMLDVLDRWQRRTMEGVRGDVLVNLRLERERKAMIDKHAARSAAGQKANAIRWGSQTDPNRIPNGSQTDPTLDARHQTLDERQQKPEVVGVAPRKRRAPDPLVWDLAQGFVGYTADDVERWRQAFPLVEIEGDILRCAEHLRSRPDKWNTKNWRKRLVAWFARSEGYAKEALAKAKVKNQRDESHIPADVLAEDRWLFWTPDGKPRMPGTWRNLAGEYVH